MNKKFSQRRQIENEVVFRQANERVQQSFDQLQRIADEERDNSIPNPDNLTFDFYCECADENCRERIPLKLNMYNEFHHNRKQFLIKPGHEVMAIEGVVLKEPDYTVVKKFDAPPEKAAKLQVTDTTNV